MSAADLTMVVGPMGAGKSTYMLSLLQVEAAAHRRCHIVLWQADTRFTPADELVTHGGLRLQASAFISIVRGNDLRAVDFTGAEVVAIDEVQFFAHAPKVIAQLRRAGVEVIAAGLDLDWQRKEWPITRSLWHTATNRRSLKAVCTQCRCKKAIYTAKIGGDMSATVEVGAMDIYQPVCWECYEVLCS